MLVGGRNALLKRALPLSFAAVGLWAVDAIDHREINGDDQANIANRTHLDRSVVAHLEITGPLRLAMFEKNTIAERRTTTTRVFWDFVEACRNAIAQVEAGQRRL